MTKWQTRREIVSPPLTMHIVFRIVDGVEERSGTHYATLDEALTHVRELNAKEKRPSGGNRSERRRINSTP
ncbi:hypothetical protein AAAV92_07090 [Selenomonas noxia]|uniref:hypothetical protein n=1 Tax=Selenomonas noxia TaxID=135083 RepID=UPI0032C1C5F2